jgi:hypothetical protein
MGLQAGSGIIPYPNIVIKARNVSATFFGTILPKRLVHDIKTGVKLPIRMQNWRKPQKPSFCAKVSLNGGYMDIK